MKKIYLKPEIENVLTASELMLGQHSGGMQSDEIPFGGDGDEDDVVDARHNLWDNWDD